MYTCYPTTDGQLDRLEANGTSQEGEVSGLGRYEPTNFSEVLRTESAIGGCPRR